MVPAECRLHVFSLWVQKSGFSILTGSPGKYARKHLGITPLIKASRAFLGDMTVYSILNHDLPRSFEPRALLALSPHLPPH